MGQGEAEPRVRLHNMGLKGVGLYCQGKAQVAEGPKQEEDLSPLGMVGVEVELGQREPQDKGQSEGLKPDSVAQRGQGVEEDPDEGLGGLQAVVEL